MLEDSDRLEDQKQLSDYEAKMEIADRAYSVTLEKIASHQGDEKELVSLLNEFYTYLYELSFYQAEIYKIIKTGGIKREGLTPIDEDEESKRFKAGEYESALMAAGRDGNYRLLKEDFELHLRTLDEGEMGEDYEIKAARIRRNLAQLPDQGELLPMVTPSFMQDRFTDPPKEDED
jgi:hypothetical protein